SIFDSWLRSARQVIAKTLDSIARTMMVGNRTLIGRRDSFGAQIHLGHAAPFGPGRASVARNWRRPLRLSTGVSAGLSASTVFVAHSSTAPVRPRPRLHSRSVRSRFRSGQFRLERTLGSAANRVARCADRQPPPRDRALPRIGHGDRVALAGAARARYRALGA